jgi:hypothetical protein
VSALNHRGTSAATGRRAQSPPLGTLGHSVGVAGARSVAGPVWGDASWLHRRRVRLRLSAHRGVVTHGLECRAVGVPSQTAGVNRLFTVGCAHRRRSPHVQPGSLHLGACAPTRPAGLEPVCCAPFQRRQGACAGPSLSVKTPRRTPVTPLPATGATATRRVGTQPPRRKLRHRDARE